jgi:hypothetical protein
VTLRQLNNDYAFIATRAESARVGQATAIEKLLKTVAAAIEKDLVDPQYKRTIRNKLIRSAELTMDELWADLHNHANAHQFWRQKEKEREEKEKKLGKAKGPASLNNYLENASTTNKRKRSDARASTEGGLGASTAGVQTGAFLATGSAGALYATATGRIRQVDVVTELIRAGGQMLLNDLWTMFSGVGADSAGFGVATPAQDLFDIIKRVTTVRIAKVTGVRTGE